MRWRCSLYARCQELAREREMLNGNARLIASILSPISSESRKVFCRLGHAHVKNLGPKVKASTEEALAHDKQWAEDLRERDAVRGEELDRQCTQLAAEIAEFQEAHTTVINHLDKELLTANDNGALAVLAIILPLTDDDSVMVSYSAPTAVIALAKLEILTPPLQEVLQWAKVELKGKELAVVELVCQNRGRVSLSALADNPRIKWKKPYDSAFNCIQRRINHKLETWNSRSAREGKPGLRYVLRRHESCAVIERA